MVCSKMKLKKEEIGTYLDGFKLVESETKEDVEGDEAEKKKKKNLLIRFFFFKSTRISTTTTAMIKITELP